MRFNRIALVAGVLALGVAACGDDVQVVEPTPPVAAAPAAGRGRDGAFLGFGRGGQQRGLRSDRLRRGGR